MARSWGWKFERLITLLRYLHPPPPELNPLRSYITDQMMDMAAELGLVVAVHTGVWGDFRALDPKHMIQTIIRHPGTKFDIYHMGVPYVRDAAIMGKNFPNVWLNLCWCHILSPKMACSAMDELIDLVPVNKVIAFGGDYLFVDGVLGHQVDALGIAVLVDPRIRAVAHPGVPHLVAGTVPYHPWAKSVMAFPAVPVAGHDGVAGGRAGARGERLVQAKLGAGFHEPS
jgi:hypothetical protein